jgi:hypothetical protein
VSVGCTAAWILRATLLVCACTATAADLDPGRVRWRAIEMQAHKFGLTATSNVSLDLPGPAAPGPALMDAPGAIPGGAQLAHLNYRSSVLGQQFETNLWLDAQTGAALQYENLNTGFSLRYRALRFADSGAYLWTRRPVGSEAKQPQDQWSDRSQGFRPFPAAAQGHGVTDAIGLLYIVAAADLYATGDEVQTLALTGRQVSRIRLRVGQPANTAADFAVSNGPMRQRCRGNWPTITVSLTVSPIAGGDPNFDFLGLRSEIRVLLEPASRLPLAVSGRAKLVGDLTIQLQQAVLASGGVCPA